MPSLEEKFGIDDMKIYAYISDGKLTVIGEIISKKIISDFSLICTVYDKDGDMIESLENCTYGSAVVTSTIHKQVFFNGYPFKFSKYFSDAAVKIGKIRIIPT